VFFDLRLIIALLFVCYGAVLTALGAGTTTEADRLKTGDVNINLWVGLVMLGFAAAMALWAVTRPIEADKRDDEADDR
jgi:TRAP-type C4-dicarboxylate transport system permease small subunit